MLASDEMTLAVRAVNQIDEQSLLVVTMKLIEDIKKGEYLDGHTLTSRVCVGDLRVHPYWWKDMYYVALIVACASGNLVRIACHAVGVNPMQADWKQLLVLCTTTSYIEQQVALKLLMQANAVMHA